MTWAPPNALAAGGLCVSFVNPLPGAQAHLSPLSYVSQHWSYPMPIQARLFAAFAPAVLTDRDQARLNLSSPGEPPFKGRYEPGDLFTSIRGVINEA
jgi:hypothetical protein